MSITTHNFSNFSFHNLTSHLQNFITVQKFRERRKRDGLGESDIFFLGLSEVRRRGPLRGLGPGAHP